ncbi:MAG: hypothetical protein ACRDIY_10050 [Chloroflexota bacterium]
MSPALRQVLDDLDPTPACVLGRRWDYLAWNKAVDLLFDIAQASSPYARNLIWQLFTSTTRRERPQWEQVARSMLAEFRTASARYPDDRWFEELIDDLKQVSPEFCQWWPHHQARRSIDGHKVIEHPTLGHLEFEHLNLQVLSDPDIRIMIYTPDDATRSVLQQSLGARNGAESYVGQRSYVAHEM